MIRARDLTRGERLLIARRREEMTVSQAADHLGVTVYRYSRWEHDEEEGPPCAVGRLASHESAFVLRRRSGLSGAEVADLVGCSAYWISLMERGQAPASRLEAFWRDSSPV